MQARMKAAHVLCWGIIHSSCNTLIKYLWLASRTRSFWQDVSTAKIFAQMETSRGLSSLAADWRSFKTYGKIPTDRARLTAQGPRSRNRPSKSRARNRCAWDSKTWRTMGSCSGGGRRSLPYLSHTSKAVSCSSKNVEALYYASVSKMFGNCESAMSTAKSHACHIVCWWQKYFRTLMTEI